MAVAPFPVVENCLQIGGVALPRLAERVGSTPFYAYDRAHIRDRVARLRQALPDSVHLSYCIKANPMSAVVQHLAAMVDGFDVASAGEMKTALDTPMPPERISFAGPGKTPGELAQAIAAGVVVNLESEGEMRRLAEIAERLGITPRVALRVNPDFELKASGMRMSGGPKAFGIDAERVPAALRELGRLGLDFHGFHVFCGSQNLRAESIRDAQAKTLALAAELAEHAPGPVRMLNIGGGFGIPYFARDAALDLEDVGQHLEALVSGLAARMPEARVVVELGRYLVGEAGVYVCRVLDRKESRGRVFLITDGGLHHHLAASGNFGQVIRRNYPVAIGNRMDEPAAETANVVGCLCTPIDVLADQAQLPRAEVGDLVVIFQSGAYGLSASPTAFLGHPAPVEILV
jgi:diaminopimelate decarboxylase